MITIHMADAADVSGLGLGALTPSEVLIEEQAGGMFELRMTHPMDETGRWRRIEVHRIIKAPAPVRETPLVQLSGPVTRELYQVNVNTHLRLRSGPGETYAVIGRYPDGTGVVKIGREGDWMQVIVQEGGATGWMHADYLVLVGHIKEAFSGDMPSESVQPRQTREQLFRIIDVEKDEEKGTVKATALHIFYDLAGNIVRNDYAPQNADAQTVCRELMARALNPHGFRLYCTAQGQVSGEYGRESIVTALLEKEIGVAAQTGARVIRDNYDVFLLADEVRDRGVEIRHGKNLTGAVMTVDASGVTTRIVPVGEDADGEKLYLDGDGYVDSPRAADMPIIRAKAIEYDVRVSDDGKEGSYATEALAKSALRAKAEADFEKGVDLPTVGLEVDFVALEQTEAYARYANLQSIHLYDTVHVISPGSGIRAALRMTGYVWDALANGGKGRYASVKLGDMQALESTVYGYDIASGTVSGGKIIPGSIGGAQMQQASIRLAHITQAAVEQLAANAITALRAHIHDVTAGSVTADQLYTDLAAIAVAELTTANIADANIDWAQISELTAQMAEIASAQIGNATITSAQISDLNAAVAEIASAQIGNATITSAQISDLNAAVAEIAAAQIGNATITSAQISDLNAAVAAIAAAQIGNATITSAQISDLNAAVAEIAAAQIENATFTSAQISDLNAAVAAIADARIGNAQINTAQIVDLQAEIASVLSLAAQNGAFQFADIAELLAQAMIIEQGVAGSVYIRNLVATQANFVGATLGTLVLQGADGNYYQVIVQSDGTLYTQQVTLTDSEIAAGVTAGGQQIVAANANIADLNAGNLQADSAVIAAIFTSALTAGQITATEAFLASAVVPELYVTAINALGDELLLKAHSIALLAQSDVRGNRLANSDFRRTQPRSGTYLGADQRIVGWETYAHDLSAAQVRLSQGATLEGDPVVYMGYDGIDEDHWCVLSHDFAAGELEMGTYTLSVYLKRVLGNMNALGFSLAARYVDAEDNGISDAGSLFVPQAEIVQGRWKRFSLTFDVTDTEKQLRILLQLPGYGGVYIGHPKLESGTYASPWTLCNADASTQVHAGSVVISPDSIVAEGAEIRLIASDNFDISFSQNDGEVVVQNMEDDGSMTFGQGIRAPNVRDYVRAATYYASKIGGIRALAEMMSRSTYGSVVYYHDVDDDSAAPVAFRHILAGKLTIIGNSGGTRCPPIWIQELTGTVVLENLVFDCPGQHAVTLRSGRMYMRNCWVLAAARGVYTNDAAELHWHCQTTAGYTGGYCSEYFALASRGSHITYGGMIPGAATESAAWESSVAEAIGTPTVSTSNLIEERALQDASITADLGWCSTRREWTQGSAYQGYSDGKGECMGCLRFVLPYGIAQVKQATLTLHRKSGVGKGAPVDVCIYGSTEEWGTAPQMGDMLCAAEDAADAGHAAVLNITSAVQALAEGSIRQLVLYAGDGRTLSGKPYSTNYCAWDEATLDITYIG